jgi:hypothetical protein
MQVALGALSKALDDDEDTCALSMGRSLAGENGAAVDVASEDGTAGGI